MLFFIGKTPLILIILGIAVVVVACGNESLPEDIMPLRNPGIAIYPTSTLVATPVAISQATDDPVSFAIPTPVDIPPGGEKMLELAENELSKNLNLSPDEITIVSIEAVDWSDSSLGCPQDGMMYAQVITPGYLIKLQVRNRVYEYHTDNKDIVVLCEQ
jgi:hypothetical protein